MYMSVSESTTTTFVLWLVMYILKHVWEFHNICTYVYVGGQGPYYFMVDCYQINTICQIYI